jgi:hypothetical protein
VSAQDYSLAATMKALRAIGKENQDKPVETRLALPRSSEAYGGFQIRCRTSAKVLLRFYVPAVLFWLVVNRRNAGYVEVSLSTIVIAALYVTMSMAVSWKLGLKAAKTKMAGPGQSGEVPRQQPLG